MSNSYNKPKSCTGRFFGTLFAFIAAAAVVYLGSYLVVFHMTGLPAANASGWLGPKLRFLATGPYQDSETGSFYKGDTKPYDVFKPLNVAWLKTQDLPTTIPIAEAAPGEAGGGEGQPGEGEGRRGRGDRGRNFGANERLDDSSTTSSDAATDAFETTGSAESDAAEPGERPRRRGGFRRGSAPADSATTDTADRAPMEGATGESDNERPRRRGGRRGEGPGTQAQ